ncbi:biotin-dependent carboxyltransferase family protein [Thiomicrospira microaerophila]|uniref:5-oxoprolinase subunit C family protein n=1 Tax=Thiomicrospira microaerophila TaxID=406020 RepID=UPI00200FEC3D|nr:biotin-dependent carboxyltransferase family protein [Thiomicrospira microaerophila]UQB41285.1 biotin-dependent carboxyltransferase family protein [Thiomicrospira microaerophila]
MHQTIQIQIEKTGPATSIQDQGRRLSQHLAIACAGVIDDYAYRWANKLLNNPLNASVIEITSGGEHWTIKQPGWLSYTGADLDAQLNQTPIKPWQTYYLNAGDQLKFNGPKQGFRAYIATPGGWQANHHYQSTSCALREKASGGWGHWLKAGDQLNANPAPSQPRANQTKKLAKRYQPDYQTLNLPIILCRQSQGFNPKQLQAWLTQPAKVMPASNRMGIRLTSPQKLEWQAPTPLSEPTANGAIQITPSGEAIILMADRQTLGGYPKIGHLSWWARCQIAQAKPFSQIQWQITDINQARNKQNEWYRYWNSSS